VRGPHSEIPVEDFDRLADALSSDNDHVAATLERWRAGDGFPRTNEVPLHDLLLASWYATRGESELDWYDDIAIALRAEGWLPVDDVTRTALRRLRGRLSFDPDGGDRAMRPDLTLIRPRSRTALVVEVKLVAVPTRGYRNPTDQVLDYAYAINDALLASPDHGRGWTVQPMLVAGEFSPPVLDAARAARAHNGVGRIVCRMWDGAQLGPNLLAT
jgi:hypothetical protein